MPQKVRIKNLGTGVVHISGILRDRSVKKWERGIRDDDTDPE